MGNAMSWFPLRLHCRIPFIFWKRNFSKQAHTRGPTTFDTADGVHGVTETVWDQHKLQQKYPELQESTTADVVVVGGGIVGMSIAHNLQRNGKNVVLIESRVRGSGQTGRTTAHIMKWWDDYYYLMEKEYGLDKTKLLAKGLVDATDYIQTNVESEGINCKYTRVPGYLIPEKNNRHHYSTLESELQASQRAGLTDTQWVDLGGSKRSGSVGRCLKYPNSAEFHPLKYVDGLAEAFVRRGGRLFENTAMISQSKDGTEVRTKQGHTIKTQHVVLATDSPANANVAVHARQEADRSYVVCFELRKGSVEQASWWDTASPYHYVRIEEREDYDVLVVGGGDHPTGKGYYDAWKHLEEYAKERWPVGKVLYRWSGQVYEPVDKLYVIGLNPLDPTKSTFIATGDSGQGMTMSALAAMVLTDTILGKPNPYADLFSPHRLPGIRDLPAQVEEAWHNVEGYSAVVLPSLMDMEDLVPESGAVCQMGVHKAAVYCDADGKKHVKSALCTHLGCLVAFNPNEKTWDCPCHGSQYDRYGHVIQGPASTDLMPLEWSKWKPGDAVNDR